MSPFTSLTIFWPHVWSVYKLLSILYY
jgi:hypothetical protein